MCRIMAIVMTAALLFISAGCASTVVKSDSRGDAEAAVEKPKINEFILGAGDSIDVVIYRNDDLKRSVKIDPSGIVMFPLIGDVQAAGKSVFALRDELRDRYSRYLVDPQITVSVSSVQSRKVLLLGEVKNPGVFSLDTDMTILDAVTKAGGWTNDAWLQKVVLVRRTMGKADFRGFDIESVLGGDPSGNEVLRGNDVVYVPTKRLSKVGRFMSTVGQILSPIVNLESGIVLWPQVEDAINGEHRDTTFALPTQ